MLITAMMGKALVCWRIAVAGEREHPKKNSRRVDLQVTHAAVIMLFYFSMPSLKRRIISLVRLKSSGCSSMSSRRTHWAYFSSWVSM